MVLSAAFSALLVSTAAVETYSSTSVPGSAETRKSVKVKTPFTAVALVTPDRVTLTGSTGSSSPLDSLSVATTWKR